MIIAFHKLKANFDIAAWLTFNFDQPDDFPDDLQINMNHTIYIEVVNHTIYAGYLI